MVSKDTNRILSAGGFEQADKPSIAAKILAAASIAGQEPGRGKERITACTIAATLSGTTTHDAAHIASQTPPWDNTAFEPLHHPHLTGTVLAQKRTDEMSRLAIDG